MNGISNRFNEVTLIGVGDNAPFEPTPDRPAVKIVSRIIGGEEYKHLQAVAEDGSLISGMAGGNFAYTSDSRFPSSYPLSLHDRVER